MQQPHANSRSSLHKAGLRDAKVRLDAMFGLDPAGAIRVHRRVGEQAVVPFARKLQVLPVVREKIHVQKEFRLGRGAATRADVVPLAGSDALLGTSFALVRWPSASPRSSIKVFGDLIQAIEQPCRSSGSMAPAQVIEVFVLIVVINHADVALLIRD